MADIFISYARADEKLAEQLRDVLAAQGFDVWRDKEGIGTGAEWEKAIDQALAEARCVIVVWSRAALASHFVRDEARAGREAGKLVPVHIDDAEIPLGFRGIQTANLVDWTGEVEHPEFQKLVRAIGQRVGLAGAALVPPNSDKAPWWNWLPRTLPAARLIGLAAAAIALFGAGYGLGRMGEGAGAEPAREPLEAGLKSFFEAKYVAAEESLRAASRKGSGLAAFYLSRMYAEGKGVRQDDAKALEWALTGAERGNLQAQNQAAFLIGTGRGGRKDEVAALAWYQRAADQGYPAAAFNSGLSFESGRGTKIDLGKAFDYYRRAAEDGNAAAGNAIADMYRFGRGIPADAGRAADWYRWAGDRGNASSQTNLGYMLANAQGIAQNDARAVDLYRRAADQNNASALNNLGWMYENGRGVGADLNQALSLYKRAADLGEKAAIANLARVQEKLRAAPAAKR